MRDVILISLKSFILWPNKALYHTITISYVYTDTYTEKQLNLFVIIGHYKYEISIFFLVFTAITQPLGRPPSAKAIQSLKAQNRGLRSNSSPVYKTQSETSILPREPNVLERGINRANRFVKTNQIWVKWNTVV